MPHERLSVDAGQLEFLDNTHQKPVLHCPVTDLDIVTAFRTVSVPRIRLSVTTLDHGGAGSIVTNDG